MDMIRVEDLSFEYIRRDEDGNVESITKAIDGVNLSVNKGDFIAVLGANGSGKSTFAKHINAILYPTEGAVWVNGMNTADEKKLWDIRQSAGMVFQNPDNQIIATVVEEDVGFGPENLGVPTEEIWQRVEESLKAVGMLEFRSMSPNRLSGGQKQRVAIAGVLAMSPECIIFDEATAMLDPTGRKDITAAMKKLNREKGITVITITHYMNEAIEADRVVVLNKGEIFLDGTPKQIFSQVEKLKSVSLSVPQVTELLYLLGKDGYAFPEGILHTMEAAEVIERKVSEVRKK